MVTPAPRRPQSNAQVSWVRGHGGILVIAMAFALLGATYSLSIPVFEVIDEPIHFLRCASLAGRV